MKNIAAKTRLSFKGDFSNAPDMATVMTVGADGWMTVKMDKGGMRVLPVAIVSTPRWAVVG